MTKNTRITLFIFLGLITFFIIEPTYAQIRNKRFRREKPIQKQQTVLPTQEPESGNRIASPAVYPVRQNIVSPKRHPYTIQPPVSLLQGDTLEGWTAAGGGPVRGNWKIENGILHCENGKKDDIATEKQFENFIFDFEWKIAKGGNSGVKYRFADFGEIGCKVNIHDTYGWLGPEYQILDDPNNQEGESPNRTTAALYHVKEPVGSKHLKPAGEWNKGRIVVMGNRIEHWLNGKKVLKINTTSKEWKDRIAKSKFAEAEGFGVNPKGHLMLQDHEDGVSFRNLFVREIVER